MRKKSIIFVILLMASLVGVIYFFSPRPAHFTEYCAFCDSHVVEQQKCYEDDLVLVLYTHKPVMPGHCLVLPKRHVERFELLTDEEILHIGRVIKKVDRAVAKIFDTSSYLLLQKNGVEVGQSVPHVHVHYIPRKKGDSSIFGFLVKMYIANAKQPLSSNAMQGTINKLRQELNSDLYVETNDSQSEL